MQLLSSSKWDNGRSNDKKDTFILRRALVAVVNGLSVLRTGCQVPISRADLIGTNSQEEPYTPDSILADPELEKICSANLNFNTTIPLKMNKDLESSKEKLLNVSRSINFKEILHELGEFELHFDNCTSTYDNLLQEMIAEQSRYMRRDALPPLPDYHMEKEVSDLQNSVDWLTWDILNAYMLENKTTFVIATELLETTNYIQGHAGALVSDIQATFIVRVERLLDNMQAQYRHVYKTILHLFVELQVYFPKWYFDSLMRDLDIWLQPVSRLDGLDLVSFALNNSTRWRSWPSYMNMRTFANKMADDVFDQIDYSFFGVIKDKLQEMNTDIVRKRLELESQLSQAFQYFSNQAAMSKVTEQHIMWVL